MKFAGFLMSFLGALSVYLSHTHQNLLPQKLPSVFSLIGIFELMLGLIFLIVSMHQLAAILSWVIFIIFLWSFIPFLALFKRNLNP